MYPNYTYDYNARIVSWRDLISRFTYFLLVLAAAVLPSTEMLAQCHPPSMVFRNPKLISGTDKKIGAVYRFSNVTTGVDCTIEVLNLVGGASLNDMDATVQGYNDAWQPYVNAVKGTTYLDWKIIFKKAGTNIDTALPCLSITAVDIDGDNSTLKEFIVASTPGAYAVDPNTLLNVSFDGVNSYATGPVTTVPAIDTNQRKYMFQMNFSNVSTIIYRNGSISGKTTIDPRHTCIYFKSFFETGLITLPVQILSFTGKAEPQGNTLNWSVADERDIREYTVQRSRDGATWENIGKTEIVEGNRNYGFSDKGGNYSNAFYRLLQVGVDGHVGFSRVIRLNQGTSSLNIFMPTVVNKQVPVQLETAANETFRFTLYNSQGVTLRQSTLAAQAGFNNFQFDLPAYSPAGIYLLAVRNAAGDVVERKRLIVQ